MQRIFMDCQVPGCERPHKARGFCAGHYQRHLRCVPVEADLKTRDTNGPETCTVDGCSEAVKAKGVCKKHYQRLLRHGHTRRTIRGKAPKACSVDGCVLNTYAKGVCHVHWMRERKMRKKFDISPTQFSELLASQGGKCAICPRTAGRVDGRSGRLQSLVVDHDHATGKVRGFLCDHCNRGIGLLGDDPALLRNAAAYLDRHAPPDSDFPVPMPGLVGDYPWPPGFVN